MRGRSRAVRVGTWPPIEERHDRDLRCDRRRRTLRRRADRDAARQRRATASCSSIAPRFRATRLSTHVIHAPGVAALRRWGLLDAVTATGCPPIETYSFDFGPFTITGTPQRTRRELRRVRATAHRARQDPRRRGPRRGSGGARAVLGRRDRRRERRGRRHPRPRRGRHDGRRARTGRDRRRRTQLAGREGDPRRRLQREAAGSSGATTRTGATCRSTASRSSSAPIAAGPPRRPTTG